MRIFPNRTALSMLAAAAGLFWWWISPPSIPYWIGEAAPGEPIQEDLARDAETFQLGEFTVRPRATFDITALVLGAERYRFDHGAGLSPLDLALGWGPMSDRAQLQHLRISQMTRFYWVKWAETATLSPRDIFLNSSNIHIIPATSEVSDSLRSIRRWSVVTLSGVLVDAWRGNEFQWRTSTTRTDTGDGACELFYVEAVELASLP